MDHTCPPHSSTASHALRRDRLRPAAADVRAGRLRRDDREVDDAGRLRQDQIARSPAKHYTCIVFDRRECGESGGRVERVTWAHLRGAGQGAARSSQDRARAHHGRLHGLLARCGVRRDASGTHAEPGAVSGRSAAPNTGSPAISASPSISPSCSSMGSTRWSTLVRRTASRSAPIRAAGRGLRSSSATRPSPQAYAKQNVEPTSSSSPAWRARCSIATLRPAPSPRT